MKIIEELRLVPIGEIKPYHRNPRRNDKTIEQLVELIPHTGFNVPILLDRQNTIVKGHARHAAAIRLGLERVPCVYTDVDAETANLDRLADNKVQELSRWDDDLLTTELASLNLDFDYDLRRLGFRIDVRQIEAVASEPALQPLSDNGEDADAPEQSLPLQKPEIEKPYITPQDIAATVPIHTQDYEKVICAKCGNTMYWRR
jgi:ParB-like chromosome segregation protein Spo0J